MNQLYNNSPYNYQYPTYDLDNGNQNLFELGKNGNTTQKNDKKNLWDQFNYNNFEMYDSGFVRF